jgi:hypothetical protein
MDDVTSKQKISVYQKIGHLALKTVVDDQSGGEVYLSDSVDKLLIVST